MVKIRPKLARYLWWDLGCCTTGNKRYLNGNVGTVLSALIVRTLMVKTLEQTQWNWIALHTWPLDQVALHVLLSITPSHACFGAWSDKVSFSFTELQNYQPYTSFLYAARYSFGLLHFVFIVSPLRTENEAAIISQCHMSYLFFSVKLRPVV